MRLFQTVLSLAALVCPCAGATLTNIVTTNAVDATGTWLPAPVSTFLATDTRV
jgi:hypothetical protein